MSKTKICTFNLQKSVISQLEEKAPNLYKGSIGKRIYIPNRNRNDSHYCLLNMDFPSNFHEYKIFILDLLKGKPSEYVFEDHQRQYITGSTTTMLQSSFPETLFDPKPLCSYLLGKEIRSLTNKSLFVVFAESNYSISYLPVTISVSYPETQYIESYDLYDFFDFPLSDENRKGHETKINESVSDDLKKILQKHNEDSIYLQTFYHPKIRDKEKKKNIKDPRFFPLMSNSHDEIISYAHFNENLIFFVFPQIKDKGKFLKEFLFQFAPNIIPDFFPEILKNQWTKKQDYYLPNHGTLLKKKENEELRHKKEIQKINDKISTNNEQFRFLHDILIQTGDNLVNSVITFLKWLGFKNVTDCDSEKNGILEEDIQIETQKGLIIIEVKGIGGTSKDSDCSQISKIKYRRSKERNSFDVVAHYLVNHQRHLPPLNRINPPFTANQINDALNDERGLMSTWQLYNLYNLIEDEIITKEDARNKFYNSGLIDFRPNSEFLGKVEELFQNGSVAILKIDKIKISVGDTLLIEKNQRFKLVNIKSLQVNDANVTEAENSEVGIQLDRKISNKSLVYLKQ